MVGGRAAERFQDLHRPLYACLLADALAEVRGPAAQERVAQRRSKGIDETTHREMFA
jgi:hypothetical protein